MNKKFLSQKEIDRILSIKLNEDKRYLKITKTMRILRQQRIGKFFNFSDPLREYLPYVIVTESPSIAVKFNKFLRKILLLEVKIGNLEDKLMYKNRNKKVDDNYEVLLTKLEEYVKQYEVLVKRLSLDDLKKEFLKNQKQR